MAGVLTLDELKSEVRHALGNRTDLDTRLTRFLNLAQQRISRVQDFNEMQDLLTANFVITASPQTDKMLSLPSLREVHSFRVIDESRSVKLKQVSTRQWDKTIPEPEYFARDVPTHYTIWANDIELFHVPDQAYEYIVRWTKWPTPFSDSDTAAVSDYTVKDELLIVLATAFAYDSLAKIDDADRKYKIAGQLMLEALNTDALEPDLEFAPTREIFSGTSTTGDPWRDPFNFNGG